MEQAHNDYLQVLADAGIVGGLLGAWFLYLLLREGFRNVRSRDNYRRGVAMGAFTGCLAILVHSLVDFVLHITAVSVMFLTLMALLVASGRRFEGDDIAQSRRSTPVSELTGRTPPIDSQAA